MKTSIQSFYLGYDQINSYINWLEQVRINIGVQETDFKKYSWEHRVAISKLNYSGVLISIYGLFEEFVESVIEEYISFLNKKCNRFDEFPEAIQKNHESHTLRLLLARTLPKYESRLNLSLIYENLKAIADNSLKVKVNKESFSFHNANLKRSTLNELFSSVGVPSILDEFSSIGSYQKSVSATAFSSEDILSWLDDNSERRNQVAHSFSNIDDVLNESLLKQRLEALKIVCESINKILIKKCLSKVLDKKTMKLKDVEAVHNCSIVCFYLNINEVKEGDYLISENGKGKFEFSEIQEVRVNDAKVDSVNLDSSADKIGVSVKVNHKVKLSNSFYIVNASEL